MRIVIVDDSKAMRLIIARTLRQANFGGHDIDEAADGTHALKLIADTHADLVLCDWYMPQMDGYQLLRKVRARGYSMPFGFVTSVRSVAMRDQAMAAGADFFIEKPCTADVFQEVLHPFFTLVGRR